MKRSNRFPQLFTITVVTLYVGILITGCATDKADQHALQKDKSSVAASEKPEQIQVPPEMETVRPAAIGPRTTPIGVPATVRKPEAIYNIDETIDPPQIPDHEIPGPAGKRKRGFGVPVPEGTIIGPESEPEPQSWTGSSTGFISTDFDDNGSYTGGYRFIPPDSSAAAGPDHVVNVVNVTISFHEKDGTQVLQQSLKEFFTLADPPAGYTNPESFTFDPKVIYDQYAQRFLVVTLEQDYSPEVSMIYVAVSDDSDPNGDWYVTSIDAKTTINSIDYWADYPGFAVDEEAVYITNNMFSFSGGAYGGVRLWILDKDYASGFYAGGVADVSIYDPYAGGGIATTTQPAHMFGAAPSSVGTFLVSYSGLSGSGNESVQTVRVDNPLISPSFTQQYTAVGDIENTSGPMPDAPQADSTDTIETNDRRALNAVWRDDKIWLATTIVGSGADAGEATAYWVALDTTSLSNITVADQGSIGGEDIASGTYTFFPSIAVNSREDVVIGFSASAPTIYPGAYFTTRESGDPSGTTGLSQVVQAGIDYYYRAFGGSRNRWGDYSGTAVDPRTGCFWFYNEYADVRGTTISGEDGRWGTAYAKSCACTPTSKPIVQNEWTMFSLACNLGEGGEYNTVSDLFPDLDTAYYGDPDTGAGTWVVFERDAVNNVYVEKAYSDPLQEGIGYWFKTSLSSVSIVNEGMKLSGADIPLQAHSNGRMNLVGHPHNADIPWADVKIWDGSSELTLDQADPNVSGTLACDYNPPHESCVVSRKMYQWNGAAYQVYDGQTTGGTLSPLDALWVEAFQTGTFLRIPATSGGASTPISQSAAVSMQSMSVEEPVATVSSSEDNRITSDRKVEDWSVRLIASSGHLEDPGNLLGQLADSSAGKDIQDLKEPEPFASPYLSIVFPHEEWEGDEWGYTTDFHALSKKPKGTWMFSVKSSDDVSEVTLRWEGPAEILQRARLIDELTGDVSKLGQDGSYTFIMQGNEHLFRFIVK